MIEKRLTREEVDQLEADHALRFMHWRKLHPLYKSYTKGVEVSDLQQEYAIETHERGNQGFALPLQVIKADPSPHDDDLPVCFNGDCNQHLTGGTNKIRQKNITNKKKTIHYNFYYKPALKLAEQKWQEGHRETTILKDRDRRKPLRLRTTLATRLMHYIDAGNKHYPTVFPDELRRLLYVFHNVLHYPLHLKSVPAPEHIHQVAIIAGADDQQLLYGYRLALEQYLVSNPPQDSLPKAQTSKQSQKLQTGE